MRSFIRYAIWGKRTQAKKKEPIEEKGVIIIPSFPTASTTISKKKRHWFQLQVHIYNSE